MAKRKYKRSEIFDEVRDFLEAVNKTMGNHQVGLEYIISQYVHLVAELPKIKQQEHINGLKNQVKELVYEQ